MNNQFKIDNIVIKMIVLIFGDVEKINRKCFRSFDQFIYISDIMLDKYEYFLMRFIIGKFCLLFSVNLIFKYQYIF